MSTQQVIELARKIMLMPLHNVSRLLLGQGQWTDAVSVQATTIDRPYYGVPSEAGSEGYKGYIHNMLGHIAVNPGNDENSDALINLYVTPHENGVHPHYVNWSPEGIRQLVTRLMVLAETERGYSHREEGKLILIHGPRGCGKTFLLNHILTKYSDLFDERLILWVRINLAAGFGGSTDLRHWIYAQCAKVLFRYYDPTSGYYRHVSPKKVPLRIREHLERYVEKEVTNPHRRDTLSKSIEKMHGIFQRREKATDGREIGLDEPLSPDLVDRTLAQEAYLFALTNGYSIIIALDGADRLEATASHYDRFAKLWPQIVECAHVFDPLRAAVVAVTRSNTLSEVPETGLSIIFTRVMDEAHKVTEVDLGRILDVREAYLTRRVPHLAPGKGWVLPDWPGHIQRFFEFLKAREVELPRSKALEAFEPNRREQMNMVRYAYLEFLRQEREPSYRFVESVVKAGRCFPPQHYRYPSSRGREGRGLGNNPFDTHFLPCIFTFPYVSGGLKTEVGDALSAEHAILATLRVLQTIHAHEYRILYDKHPPSRLTVDELLNLCGCLFEYPRDLMLSVIEEGEQFGLLELRSPDFPTPIKLSGMEILTTSKSAFMLNWMLYDVAYLNLASMRTPLARAALIGNVPYFCAVTRDLEPPYGVSVVEWVAAKITNVVSIYRLIQAVNQDEERKVNERYPQLKPRLQATIDRAIRGGYDESVGMFDFTDRMVPRLLAQMQRMLDSLPERECTRVYDRLNVHSKTWIQS